MQPIVNSVILTILTLYLERLLEGGHLNEQAVEKLWVAAEDGGRVCFMIYNSNNRRQFLMDSTHQLISPLAIGNACEPLRSPRRKSTR